MAGGALVGGMIAGGILGGFGGLNENWKRQKEKSSLEKEYRELVSLYSPTRRRLLEAYMPGGEFSQRMAAVNREQSNLQQQQGEEAARANAWRTGGIRSGAVDRGRRGSWLNLMAQGQTTADIAALSRLAAQDLASKGAEIRAYQYPGFGSGLEGTSGAVVEFAKAYDAYKNE